MKREASSAIWRSIESRMRAWGEAGPERSAVLSVLDGSGTASWRAEATMPAASLVKILLAETALRRLEASETGVGTVAVRSLVQTEYPSVLVALNGDRELSIPELCGLAIVTSDNPSAQRLVELVGATEVNAFARESGLAGTHFGGAFTDSGIETAGRSHVTTAADMERVFRRLFMQKEADPVCASVWLWLENNLRNSRIPGRLPNGTRVAHKTGTLDDVVNDAGVIMTQSPYVLVLLSDSEPDHTRASDEMATLSLDIFELLGGPTSG